MATARAWDALVVGGGPAGAAAAIVLARAGRRVALVESSRYRLPRVGEHLPPRALPLLARLGAVDLLSATGALECPGIRSVWGRDAVGHTDYLFSPYGRGWNLDRRGFDEGLSRIAVSAGVDLSFGRVVGVERGRRGWTATIGGQEPRRRITARFLVDATGRTAWLARRLGARRVRVDRLVGVVTWFRRHADDPDRTLLVEGCERGWWYSLPLPDDRMVGVFMTDAAELAGRPADVRRAFLGGAAYTRDRLRGLRRVAGPLVRPADSARLEPMTGEAWLAVGDAALSLDPLSSDGIVHALESGIAAGTAVHEWLGGGNEALDRYAAAEEAKFAAYLEAREKTYWQEGRWREKPFWRRRREESRIRLSPHDVVVLSSRGQGA